MLKGPNGKACPGITIGHFESAKELSYAFLLVPKSEPTGGYKIVVFSKGPTGDAYAWKLLDHADGETYSGLVISKADPGKYSDFEGTKSIQTKLDGVYVEWMEKGAVLITGPLVGTIGSRSRTDRHRILSLATSEGLPRARLPCSAGRAASTTPGVQGTRHPRKGAAQQLWLL